VDTNILSGTANRLIGVYHEMNLHPDIFIEVRFKTSAEGGRQTPITIPAHAGYYYDCPLFIDGEGFDCRILLKGVTLELGKTYDYP
jgi:hypothetical protein